MHEHAAPNDQPYPTDGQRALAAALLAGAWEEQAMQSRAQAALRGSPADLSAIVRGVLTAHALPPHDAPLALARQIAALGRYALHPRALTHARRPREAPRWPVPMLQDTEALARWLDLDAETLMWLADAKGLERRAGDERLHNYRYTWLPRASGVARVIEAPKSRLKEAQRHVLDQLLSQIPVHDAAHGFRLGASAVTHAAVHTRRAVVLRLDLRDFFASVAAGRVFGILRLAGYPDPVAHALTALVTNAVPARWWATVPRPAQRPKITAHHHLGRRLATPHLPQGAPTSPALANLCAFALDRRLTALAASMDARYTRYADDLVISGDTALRRRASVACTAVAAIVTDEGFALHDRKTRIMSAAGRQDVCGITVNAHPNVARGEVDRLKAILYALERDGHAVADRTHVADLRTHLRGRIDWVAMVNPARGARLRARYDALAWA